MRHLTLVASVPSKEELRATIPHRERYRPEPRLLVAPQLRSLPDGTEEIHLPRDAKWKPIHPMHADAARALAEGLPVSAAIERAKARCPPNLLASCEKVTRKFLWRLHSGGVIEIPLPPPPETFAGKYSVVSELGRGGMGVVYLCRDEAGSLVAVKHAWGWTKPIERAEHTIRQEAHILAQLDHPNIPPLLDAFESDGLLHMVRGYAPGASLRADEDALRRASSETRLRILRGCAAALGHVHDRGFLYLDVKKDNFMIDGHESAPLLLDFGVARKAGPEGIALHGGVGSQGYAAPEVVREHRATRRSDVFSLGRTFAMLASGRRFKFRHTVGDVEEALRSAGVADRERAVLVRMCEDDPAKRVGSMDEVLREIG